MSFDSFLETCQVAKELLLGMLRLRLLPVSDEHNRAGVKAVKPLQGVTYALTAKATLKLQFFHPSNTARESSRPAAQGILCLQRQAKARGFEHGEKRRESRIAGGRQGAIEAFASHPGCLGDARHAARLGDIT